MKKTLLAVLACLLAAAPVRAKKTAALLWVPAYEPGWTALLSSTAAAGIKITIAVSPEDLDRADKELIAALAAAGSMEIAARIHDDPVLPLLFNPSNPAVTWAGKPASLWPDRLDETAGRIFAGLERHKTAFGAAKGWVPAGGAATPQIADLARAYKLGWLAIGAAGRQPATASSGTAIIPFIPIIDYDSFSAEIASAPEDSVLFAVVDETIPPQSTSTAAELIARLAEHAEEPAWEWATVSETIAAIAASTETPVFTAWTENNDYSLWASSRTQLSALYHLGQAKKTLSIYKSSMLYKKTDGAQAEELLSGLESGAKLSALGHGDAAALETESEFKSALSNIYRLLDQPVPPYLLHSFSDDIPADDAVSASTGNAAVSIVSGDSYIRITNPEKTLEPPDNLPARINAPDAAKFARIDSVEIKWDDSGIEFRLENSSAASQAAAWQRALLADIYIDMNNRARSGSVGFLEGRQLRAAPEDGWEFALSLNSGKANLYKATPQGASYIGSYPAKAGNDGVISVKVPRSVINGNPLRWGYSVLVMFYGQLSQDGKVFKPSGEPVDVIALDRSGSSVYSLRVPRKY